MEPVKFTFRGKRYKCSPGLSQFVRGCQSGLGFAFALVLVLALFISFIVAAVQYAAYH